MKKLLKNLLLLVVACGSSGATFETVLAQSCYDSAGNAGHNRFGAGRGWECNVDGFGSPIIGAFYNDTFGSNEQVTKAYKIAGRDAIRAYNDGARCINKLPQSGDIDSDAADGHPYLLKTEFEDLQAAWEDWHEDYYGELCQ